MNSNVAVNIQQDTFAREIVKGTEPKQAMFIAYPKTKNNTPQSQATRLSELMRHPKIVARVEELYKLVREEAEKKDLYSFEKGVQSLNKLITKAEAKIDEREISEAMSRVIISAIQELNRMFGYSDAKNKNQNENIQIVFVNGSVNNNNVEGDINVKK